MTKYNFDEIIERRGTDSDKWGYYDPDVIPMFVADMDFRSPQPVIDALVERAQHGVFGYGMFFMPPPSLTGAIGDWLARRHGLKVEPEHIVVLPNLVNGIYVAAQAIGQPGDHILVNTPIYWPFVTGAEKAKRPLDMVPLRTVTDGHTLRYEIDFDALEAAITPQTRLFLLCNPHNPVGRVFEKWELETLAEICLRHDMVICSDEIHGDMVYSPHRHTPIATLAPEVAARTITLHAASKTFNIAGIGLGYAIIPDVELRERFKAVYESMGVHATLMGYVATETAYREGQPWLDALMTYLQDNRDFVADYVREHFPNVRVTVPEGTYLSWLDFREAGLPGEPCAYFLEQARVALSGNWELQGFEGFARLNFGCPRPQLKEALDRLHAAYARVERV